MERAQYASNPYAAPQAAVAGAREPDQEEFQEVRIWSASGRMGRVRYVVNGIGMYLLFSVCMGLISAALGRLAPQLVGTVFLLVAGVAYIALMVVMFLLMIQRCHDFDASGWLSLLMLVPLVNFIFALVLLLMPGSKGSNRFGAPTPPNTTFSVILACVIPLLFVGILAAVAIPAYQQYSMRAQMHGR